MRSIHLTLSGLIISSIGSGQDIPDRPPDVVSQRAKIEDYYKWDGHKWVWSEDANDKNAKIKSEAIRKLKGIVTFGEPTIKWIEEPPVKHIPNPDNTQCKEKFDE
jgi:hypothetical protein